MTGFTGSGAAYSGSVTATADYTISVAAGAARDGTGNDTPASSSSGTFDDTAPTVAITGVPAAANGAFTATFTFSEPVTGFATTDTIDATVTGAAVSEIAGVGDGSVYTALITPTADYAVSVAADVAQDAAGNNNTASESSSGVYDTTAPTVAITGVPATTSGAFTATFTFSESVTGFEAGDIALSNATASNFSGSAATYTATVTPASSGAYSVSVAAGVARDAATNGNTASATASGTATIAVTLAVGAMTIKETAATLTISGHTAAWWYKGDQSGATCTAVAAGTAAAALSGLTGGATYVYKAYDAAGCGGGDLLATAAAFTTISLTVSAVTATTATLHIGNNRVLSLDWSYKQTSPSGPACRQDGIFGFDPDKTSDALTGLTASTGYIFTAYRGAGCAAASKIADVAFTTSAATLTAGAITKTTATLTLSGHANIAWWYKGDQRGARCTAVAANTATANLDSLAVGAEHTYKAYNAAGCGAAAEIASRTFSTLAGGRLPCLPVFR